MEQVIEEIIEILRYSFTKSDKKLYGFDRLRKMYDIPWECVHHTQRVPLKRENRLTILRILDGVDFDKTDHHEKYYWRRTYAAIIDL